MSTIMTIVTNLSACTTLTEAVAASEGNKDLYLAWGKEKGETVKELNEAWKEAQPKKASGGAKGFAAEFYDWLAEDSRTELEARDYILSPDNSKNVHNHLTHYLNIWALAETVRSGSKVLRSVSASKSTSASGSSKKAPVIEEVSTQSKELKRVLTSIAKGEYKTVTVVRNQLKVLAHDELEEQELDKLSAALDIANEKGIKVDAIQAEVIKLLNK